MSYPPIILASSSPRRKWLLAKLGVPFEIFEPSISEVYKSGETPDKHVLRLSAEKAAAIENKFAGRVIIAADTAVVLSGKIFGKPRGPDDALRMLKQLQGLTHTVLTGYAVIDPFGKLISGLGKSLVTIRELTDHEIKEYLDVGEYVDKAGAYAAQGEGAKLIRKIKGSYTNVVGLPLTSIRRILTDLGYTVKKSGGGLKK